MISKSMRRSLARAAAVVTSVVLAVAIAASANAASNGLAVVIANSYDGHLPASLRDADAVADKLEENGFDAVRLRGASGGDMVAAIALLREAAEAAGPNRIVYMSGFGMCFNDDLVLFAEDMQPEQFKSGQIAEVVVPLSLLADAAASGADHVLVVFDTVPRQCTRDMVNAVKLPENTTLLITTGIGGDIVDEIDEGGMSAFATSFVELFNSDQKVEDVVTDIVAQIRETTEDQQVPILVGKP